MIGADREKLINDFCRLVEIDSESLNEREMADALKAELKALGFEVTEDNAGRTAGGTAGNLFAVLKGDPDVEPLLLSGHMDTVKPGIGKKAVIDAEGRITGNGRAVLGADDLSGVVEILEGVRLAKSGVRQMTGGAALTAVRPLTRWGRDISAGAESPSPSAAERRKPPPETTTGNNNG